MKRPRIEHIESLAERVLQESGAYRLPVPIESIADHLNLRATASDLDDEMSGVLVFDGKRGAIAYNSSHASVRQRFTVAHEIGHYMLHVKNSTSKLFLDRYTVYRRDDQSSHGNDREEIEANAFAAALLMPERLVRQEIKKHDLDLDDEDDLDVLAKRFSVSTTAMTFRLGNLGLLR
jgi:Zn-dependent peptidase ImmA (M78 family)